MLQVCAVISLEVYSVCLKSDWQKEHCPGFVSQSQLLLSVRRKWGSADITKSLIHSTLHKYFSTMTLWHLVLTHISPSLLRLSLCVTQRSERAFSHPGKENLGLFRSGVMDYPAQSPSGWLIHFCLRHRGWTADRTPADDQKTTRSTRPGSSQTPACLRSRKSLTTRNTMLQ